MKLYNPTENKLEVKIFGSKFILEGKKEIRVADNVGKYWMTLHAFLVETPDNGKEISEKIEKTIEPETEEIEEPALDEEVEEKETKKTAKKK